MKAPEKQSVFKARCLDQLVEKWHDKALHGQFPKRLQNTDVDL